MIDEKRIVQKSCPVNQTLDFFDRKWIFSILTDLFVGKKHFSQFLEENHGLNNYTLAETLKYMEEKGLIIKVQNDGLQKRTSYKLTDLGKRANRILYEMALFSIDNLENSYLDEVTKNHMIHDYENFFEIG